MICDMRPRLKTRTPTVCRNNAARPNNFRAALATDRPGTKKFQFPFGLSLSKPASFDKFAANGFQTFPRRINNDKTGSRGAAKEGGGSEAGGFVLKNLENRGLTP